ncbi:hypothetical protein FS837_005569, partial [Tulasnella sp. UAMH 9824]
ENGQANTLSGLGEVYHRNSKDRQAKLSYTRAHEIYSRTGDENGQANALYCLGKVCRWKFGWDDRATSFYTQAWEIYLRIADENGQANALYELGEVYRTRSKYDQATSSYNQAYRIYSRIGDEHGQTNALYGMAQVAKALGPVRYAHPDIPDLEETSMIYAHLGNSCNEREVSWALSSLRLIL